MDSQESKDKLEGKMFSRSTRHGYEPFQLVIQTKVDEWVKGKLNWTSLLRWERIYWRHLVLI